MESVEDNVGLSDIIDILNTLDSPSSPDSNGAMLMGTPSPTNPQQHTPQQQQPQAQHLPQQSNQQPPATTSNRRHKPCIKILEQPAGKALRFRYKCEGRSAGSIPGTNSTPENKTFPSIEIVGFKGDVVIVVSLVTKDPPYRPHPHNLVGRECKNGICTLTLTGDPLRAVFSNLGIQCVKKKEIKSELDVRESLKVDPFRTKFAHKDQPSSIDLNTVRLCFQAFLKTADGHKPLTPVVTDPIYDKKAMSDLVICRLCSCSAKVGGGDEIIMLCEKVAKDDIKVKFYELNAEGQSFWEDYAEFQQTDIHKQTAIVFKTPRYHTSEIMEKTKVFIQLLRPSDGVTSESLPFEYYPDPDQIKRKRIKTGGSSMNLLRRELQKHEQLQHFNLPNDFKDVSVPSATIWNTPLTPAIKNEPTMSPQHFGSHRSPYHMSPSPQPQPQSPMNRIDTPSPGLMKAMSAGSQAQMCDMFNFNTINCQTSPEVYQQQQTQQQYLNGGYQFIANNNNNNGIDQKYASLSNGLNTIINHRTLAPSTSGGSITPLWSNNTPQPIQNIPSPQQLPQMNIINPQQQSQQQPQPQQHFQQSQQIQLLNDFEIFANTEECPTLSGLMAMVEGEQLMNINSEDLPLSNLSIST